MKKYLLFVVCDFSDESKSEYITDIISEVTSSTFCNSKLSNESIIINFGYSEDFNILSKYVKNTISNFVDYYILTEYNDNMSLMFPNDESERFLLLDENYDEKNIDLLLEEYILDELTIKGVDLLKEYMLSEQTEEDDQDDDILIKKSIKKEYNLDDILDKINEKGVSSLTKEENEYLKNLSK